MRIGEKYETLIAEREKFEGDIDYDSNPVIKEMVELLTDDVNATVSFLDTECSESQFIWMSEIFDEIAERIKDREFIKALRRVAGKYPEAVEKYNIDYLIDSAEEYIE
ncbi:MAG: hypothetical protein IKI12_07335 [Lachnospiraceae bacterium]|nr:hypothetical protein [Lachnospiraceae bacterium]